MSKESRDRWRRQAQPVKPFNGWPIITAFTLATVALVLIFSSTKSVKSDNKAGSSTPALHANSSTLARPIYMDTSDEELAKMFIQLIDDHPDRNLSQRLKKYFDGQAGFSFVRTAYLRGLANVPGVELIQVGAVRGSVTPLMQVDILLFDPQYTRRDYAFRLLSHEGYHLDRVIRKEVPFERLTRERAPSREDIRLMFEEEVSACKIECDFAKGRPLARIPNSNDRCDLYWSDQVTAFRRDVAAAYILFDPFKQYADYIEALAINPDLP